MLVLTRKCEQEVVLSEYCIRIRILAIRGNRVCVGVFAPPEMPIRRGELPELPGGNGRGQVISAADAGAAKQGT